MTHPLHVEGCRVCVLIHPDELVICANRSGFKALGNWMAWLADSSTEEHFHMHLFSTLESEACRFEGVTPKNVWFLRSPSTHEIKIVPPEGMEVRAFELTFQMLTDADLDELAVAQEIGLIPSKFLKQEASYLGQC